MGLAKTKNNIDYIAKTYNVANQTLWDVFFFERFLHRLSVSKYKSKFTFKGGFLLGSIVGLAQRTTIDIDFNCVGLDLNSQVIYEVIQEISRIDLNDQVEFEVQDIIEITREKKYRGKSVRIQGRYYNIKKIFCIDIAAGDVITPRPVIYKYISRISDLKFDVFAYSIETILAEKIETLISKGSANSRMKDFFDIYLLSKLDYDANIFNSSIINTFYTRRTVLNTDILNKTNEILSSLRIVNLFDNYVKKNRFTNDLKYEECASAILKVVGDIKINEKMDLNGTKVFLLNYDKYFIKNNVVDLDETFETIVLDDFKKMNILTKKLSKIKHEEIKYLKTLDEAKCMENITAFYYKIKVMIEDVLLESAGKRVLILACDKIITMIYCILNGLIYSELLKINIIFEKIC